MANEVAVIKVYAHELDAIMAQEVLQQAGVSAFIFADDAGGMEPHLQRTLGVRLLVSQADAARALEILQTLTSG